MSVPAPPRAVRLSVVRHLGAYSRPADARDDALPDVWGPHARQLLAALVGGPLCLITDPAALDAAIRDGAARRLVATVCCPVDFVDGSAVRAAAVALAVGSDLSPDMVIGLETAVWVHAGGYPPPRIQMITPTTRRRANIAIRESRLEPRDVERIGGCPVTTPERTERDLLAALDDVSARRGIGALERSGQLRVHAFSVTP